MAWRCPNKCHHLEGFRISQDEYREDTIVHFYAATDESLEDETHHKVYTGDAASYGVVQCATCAAVVVWVPEIKEEQ